MNAPTEAPTTVPCPACSGPNPHVPPGVCMACDDNGNIPMTDPDLPCPAWEGTVAKEARTPQRVRIRIDLEIDEWGEGEALTVVSRALDSGALQEAIKECETDELIEIEQATECEIAEAELSAEVALAAASSRLSPAGAAVLQEITNVLGAADLLLAADTSPPERQGDEYRRLLEAVRESCLKRIARSVQ